MTAQLKPHRFLAIIYKIWMMRHVEVPKKVSAALATELVKARKGNTIGNAGKPKYIPVVAIVNERSARVMLVPAGGGRYRMQINRTLRKAAQVDAGDLVSVELRLDRDSRDLPVPPDLRAGLKRYPKAKKAFEELTPAHRRHIIEYFDSAKSPQARERRLERVADVLLERALLQPKRRAPATN
jgi:hypothetical protein